MTFRLVDTLRWMIFDAGHRVGMSTFSRQQADRGALLRSYGDNARFMSLFAHPALAGVAVTAPELVPVLLGAQWAAAIPLVQVMALAALVQSIAYRSEVVANALGRPTMPAFFFAGVLAVMVGGMFAFHPTGALAALGVWMVAMLGLAPIWIVMVCRLTGWSPLALLGPGSRALGAALVMAGIVLAADHLLLGELRVVTRLLVKVATGLVSYAAVTLVLNRQAVLELRGLIRRDHAEAV
jgi:PST family polysaccharide transporter